jgi:hypothetical protein
MSARLHLAQNNSHSVRGGFYLAAANVKMLLNVALHAWQVYQLKNALRPSSRFSGSFLAVLDRSRTNQNL